MIRNDFLPLARPSIGEEEVEAVSEVVRSGWWTTGPKVLEFQDALASYLQEKEMLQVAALNSCTSALFLALKALGIREGDEVIVPTWTFAATAQVVEWLGAVPLLCDIEGDSLTIDTARAQELATPKTKAIVPVHIAGYPCDMDKVADLARQNGLRVVEDAAHAIGTSYRGTRIGNFSDVTCFSFYATKNLAMGEGGAAVSRDGSLIAEIEKLAYFGINKEAYKRYNKSGTWLYDIEELGYKCNLDSMHAALGLAQLKKLDRLNARRRQIAARYRSGLDDCISFTRDSDEHYHTFHLFPVLLPGSVDRDGFIAALKERNIGASVHFIPLHRHSHYRPRYPEGFFPVADRYYERVVSIPMFPSMTDEDVDYVILHINDIMRKLA